MAHFSANWKKAPDTRRRGPTTTPPTPRWGSAPAEHSPVWTPDPPAAIHGTLERRKEELEAQLRKMLHDARNSIFPPPSFVISTINSRLRDVKRRLVEVGRGRP